MKATIPLIHAETSPHAKNFNFKDIIMMSCQFLAAFIVITLVLNYNGELPTGSIIDNKNVIKYSRIWISNIFKIVTAFLAICYIQLARKIRKNKKLFGERNKKTKHLNTRVV